MTISLLFSLTVYRISTIEIARGLRLQALRMLPREGFSRDQFEKLAPPNFHQQVFEEAKRRIAWELFFINLGIFVVSGTAGYFLAGITLKPIGKMLEDQKRFVSDASHELRTPLTVIKIENEVALRDKKISLKNAKKIIMSNLEEIEKLKSLTDYFLTLSKYDQVEIKHPFESFKLTKTTAEVCNRFKGLIVAKKITLIKNFKEITINANKTSIVELITILLDNAIKYSHEKGKIILSLNAKGGSAVLEVKDFGPGIKATALPYIFNRFYRADTSRTKNRIKGYGLGLAIAKSIVNLHKGKITVESTLGKGSTFTVLLPKN